jgi:FkbM family methyltransferase
LLPLRIYTHWTTKEIEKELWPAERPLAELPWVGRTARLPNGMRIEVDPREHIGRRLIAGEWYEPDTVSYVKSHLRPGMTFFDIGAHIGQYSLLASQLVGPHGKVHSFEPCPTLFPVLKRNTELNHCSNVICNEVALAEADGVHQLYLSDFKNFGTSSFAPSGRNYSGVSVRVTTVSLDEYVGRNSVQAIDLIKLDVEGMELQVLAGARATLARFPKLALIVEFNEQRAVQFEHSVADLAEFLHARGFHLYLISKNPLVPYTAWNPSWSFVNVLATRNQHLPACRSR